MTTQIPDYKPRRINRYVPAMAYAVDVSHSAPTQYKFGTPAAADTDGILTDSANLNADSDTTLTSSDFDGALGDTADAEYGRNVTATASGATGDTVTVTVNGRDYWGQPMTEEISITNGNGTNTQSGAKAFYTIDSVNSDGGGTNAETIEVGWGSELGLPYKTVAVHVELSDGTQEASTGTLTAPVLTDPQTATTGDPRGTYNTNVTLDGSTEVEVYAIADRGVNDDGNGGLLGIKHFYA
jgi:hypothetical protein